MVARGGIDPPTRGFSVAIAINLADALIQSTHMAPGRHPTPAGSSFEEKP
jgi:hypothetical protein